MAIRPYGVRSPTSAVGNPSLKLLASGVVTSSRGRGIKKSLQHDYTIERCFGNSPALDVLIPDSSRCISYRV